MRSDASDKGNTSRLQAMFGSRSKSQELKEDVPHINVKGHRVHGSKTGESPSPELSQGALER